MLPDSLSIALKEWAAVVNALRSGRQMILLRKGGIHESAGEFEIEHRRFILFPTWLHQNTEMVKLTERHRLDSFTHEPDQIPIDTAAEITDIIQLRDRKQMDAVEDAHIWSPPLIDMRFNYRRQNPLYLLILRAFRLAAPITIQNTPACAGCKSWVPLEREIDTRSATAVIDHQTFEMQRRALCEAGAARDA